jgi:hypothetical protein
VNAALLLVVGLTLPEAAEIRERTDSLYAEASSLCEDAQLVLDAEEHALYCPVVTHASRCPALAEACDRGPRSTGRGAGGSRSVARNAEEEGDGEGESSTERDEEADSPNGSGADVRRALREQRRRRDEAARDEAGMGETERDETTTKKEDDEKLELPLWLRQLASLAFYAAIAAMLLVVARLLLRHFASTGDDDALPPDDEPPSTEATSDATSRIVETDVARLLARARARNAAGDHRGAIEDVYAALLRKLEGAGLVELHPSKTNGDYLRRLVPHPALRAELASVVREVERVQFGDEPVGAERSSRFFELTRPLFERVLALVLLLLGSGMLEGCDTPERANAQHRTMHASGYEALLELLDDAGVDAEQRTSPLTGLGDSGTLVLLPDAELDETARLELESFAQRGGNVVFVGRPQRARAGIGTRQPASASMHLELRGAVRSRIGAHTPIVAPRRALTAEPGASDVLRRDGLPYAIELERGDVGGRIALFADEALFSNLGLAIGDNATFTVRYLASLGEGPVELVDGMTGVGATSPIEAVRRAELLPVLLQLFLVFGLYAAWRGTSFGKPRGLSTSARRAYVEHAVALGALYRRARAAPHAAGLVSSYALDRLRERVASPERRGIVDLAGRVAARSGRPLAEVVDVLERAHRARAQLAEAARASHLARDRPSPNPGRPTTGDEREAERLLRELDAFLELDALREPPGGVTTGALPSPPTSAARTPRVTEDPR